MTNQPDLTKFRQKLLERRAREAEKEQTTVAPAQTSQFDDDLIPETAYERSEQDLEMDQVIERIDIIDAYVRWCGKMMPQVRGDQREGIKISCPIPGHIDKDPSAWINLDKQTWFCGGCQTGGDKYDIAAYRLGMSDYKEGANFHKLREKMASDFGYTITRHAGGVTTIVPPVIEPDPEPEEATVTAIYEEEDDDQPIVDVPSLDWRQIVPPQTFLDEYMKATVVDDVPEEYHFFHGLVAIGFALGRDVALFDAVPVYGNLFVCTLGRSGTGKSKARRHLNDLLQRALPYDRTAPVSRGVLRVNAPGSAESLIYSFMKPEEDPTNPKKIVGYLPVRGLIDFNELASLVARSRRQGSALAPTLMQFYDMEDVIQTSSMTTGSKEAHNSFASALTTTQPRSLRGLVDAADDASGFLNRWLFVPGKEKERFAVGGVQVDISPAIEPLQHIQVWAATFGTDLIQWSTEALELFTNWFRNVLEPKRKIAQNDLLVRMDLTMKKLILLLSANKLEAVVSGETVQQALFCYDYLVASYGIPESQIGNTVSNEIAESVIHVCQTIKKKTGRGATLRDISDRTKRRKYDRKRLMEVIDVLVKLDQIEVEASQPGKVGRPTKRYTYVGG